MEKHATIAALLYVVDAWGIGQGIWATVPAVVIVLTILLRSKSTTQKLQKVLLWSAVPIATIGTMVLFGNIAQRRADSVIHAVEAYHAAEGRYPAQLTDVTPKYLSRIPRSTPRLTLDQFYYLNSNADRPFLMWVVLPPFGRNTYDFESKRHSSLD